MRNILILARKEFSSYFHTWQGVFVTLFFFLVSGLFFSLLFLGYAKLSMSQAAANLDSMGLNQTDYIFGSFYMNLSTLLIFIIPVLTMRGFSEERRDQTLELLYTYPLSDFEIVMGKFLGQVWMFELLAVPLLGYGLIAQMAGADFDWRVVFLAFVGFWMLGLCYLALGFFISTLTKSPVLSAVSTFGVFLVFWVLEWAAKVSDGRMALIFQEISPLDHYRYFTIGQLHFQHCAYFALAGFFFMTLSVLSISTRNWKSS